MRTRKRNGRGVSAACNEPNHLPVSPRSALHALPRAHRSTYLRCYAPHSRTVEWHPSDWYSRAGAPPPPLELGEPSDDGRRILRALPATPADSTAVVPVPMQKRDPKIDALVEMATSLGFCVVARDKYVMELAQQIATRLKPRSASNV